MIKKLIAGELIFFGTLGLIHLFLWQINLPILRSKRPVSAHVPKFSVFRAQFEASQKEKLHRYHWVDKRNGYVQIPIERAFNYYLRTRPEL